MRSGEGQAADWREAAGYAPLLTADRAVLAWEWLRRRADYKQAVSRWLDGHEQSGWARTPVPEPHHWGLHRYETPDLPVPQARPIWRQDVHPYVLQVEASDSGAAADRFDLAQFRSLVTIVSDATSGEHLLLSDGFRGLRIDVVEGSLRSGPVQLRYRLSGIGSAQAPVRTLKRLLVLCRSGRFSSRLHRPERRASRVILMLRAYDAVSSGASQREIAANLLSSEAHGERWRVEAPALRSRVQRLVRNANAMAKGGYLWLLRR